MIKTLISPERSERVRARPEDNAHDIADRAAAVIFVHNHPSGDLQPSEADRRTHEQLTEAAKILGLRVLDHVIVTKKGHFSFQEAGLIR